VGGVEARREREQHAEELAGRVVPRRREREPAEEPRGEPEGGSGILKNGATNSPIAASAANPLATLPLQRDETPAKKSLFAGESAAEDDARARGDASS
jgi:hypothetical protein